jgi:hypothetical protein
MLEFPENLTLLPIFPENKGKSYYRVEPALDKYLLNCLLEFPLGENRKENPHRTAANYLLSTTLSAGKAIISEPQTMQGLTTKAELYCIVCMYGASCLTDGFFSYVILKEACVLHT